MKAKEYRDIVDDLVVIQSEMNATLYDLSSIKGMKPFDYFSGLAQRLDVLNLAIKEKEVQVKSESQNELRNIRADFDEINQQAKEQLDKILECKSRADKITKQLLKKHDDYLRDIKGVFSAAGAYSVQELKQSKPLESTLMPQMKSWEKIRHQLEDYHADESNKKHLQQTSQNILSQVLTSDDEDFIELFKHGKIAISGEVGHLAMQRLVDIAANSDVDRLRKKASTELKMHNAELLDFHRDEFEVEVNKLVLYSMLHSDEKIIWIGTASAVNYYINKPTENSTLGAAYLNCDDAKWGYELNRAWLQAATELGYEFQLTEQHLPNVERAILSNETDRFLTEMVSEMREARDKWKFSSRIQDNELLQAMREAWQTSQYDGKDSPTATVQEVMVLMDLGYQAKKNDDGAISLHHPERITRESRIAERTKVPHKLKRSHSVPSLFHTPELPVSKGEVKEHLGGAGPKDSVEIRNKNK